ncbi:MAG: hypothetical protein D6698_08955 [Gammaproteobacteria bacterium]|nr:MAG: hypothetical protein D6698_08955 [Gammaproteobacteria bacterium]
MIDFIGQDFIDSRNVIEKLEEINGQLEDTDDLDESELDELLEDKQILESIVEQCSDVPDWEYGETLIRSDYFPNYIEDLCKDCGWIPQDLPWWLEIDWDKTAENCKIDYMSVDICDETYYIRDC